MRKERRDVEPHCIREDYTGINSSRAVDALRQKVALFVFDRRFNEEELNFLNECIEKNEESDEWPEVFRERFPDLTVRVHIGGGAVEEIWGDEHQKKNNALLHLDLYKRAAFIIFWDY